MNERVSKVVAFVIVTDPPGPPQNVRIENLTSSSCTLAWEAPSFDGGSEIKGYYVERSSGYSSRFVKVNRDPIARTQQTYSDLVEGTEYEYRVTAENEAGIGKPSETTGVFVAKDPYAKPGKPGTPTVKEISKGAASVEWDAPTSDGGAEITHYVVEVCRQLCTSGQLTNYSTLTHSWRDTSRLTCL